VRAFRPPALVAAAVVLGGLGVAMWPQHWPSIVHLTVASAAVAACLHVLRTSVMSAEDRIRPLSPLDHVPRRRPVPAAPAGLERTLTFLRGARSAKRQVKLPWRTAEQLKQAVTVLLERHGFDPSVAADRATVRAAVSPLTWKILTEPRVHHKTATASDGRGVTGIVHAVLDDLERLASDQILSRTATETPPHASRDANVRPTRGTP
jgi:hypothetical protein